MRSGSGGSAASSLSGGAPPPAAPRPRRAAACAFCAGPLAPRGAAAPRACDGCGRAACAACGAARMAACGACGCAACDECAPQLSEAGGASEVRAPAPGTHHTLRLAPRATEAACRMRAPSVLRAPRINAACSRPAPGTLGLCCAPHAAGPRQTRPRRRLLTHLTPFPPRQGCELQGCCLLGAQDRDSDAHGRRCGEPRRALERPLKPSQRTPAPADRQRPRRGRWARAPQGAAAGTSAPSSPSAARPPLAASRPLPARPSAHLAAAGTSRASA